MFSSDTLTDIFNVPCLFFYQAHGSDTCKQIGIVGLSIFKNIIDYVNTLILLNILV